MSITVPCSQRPWGEAMNPISPAMSSTVPKRLSGVESRIVSAAARALKLPLSTVSRRLADLEAQLAALSGAKSATKPAAKPAAAPVVVAGGEVRMNDPGFLPLYQAQVLAAQEDQIIEHVVAQGMPAQHAPALPGSLRKVAGPAVHGVEILADDGGIRQHQVAPGATIDEYRDAPEWTQLGKAVVAEKRHEVINFVPDALQFQTDQHLADVGR